MTVRPLLLTATASRRHTKSLTRCHPNELIALKLLAEKIAVSTLSLRKTYGMDVNYGGVAKPGGDFMAGREYWVVSRSWSFRELNESWQQEVNIHSWAQKTFTEDEVLVGKSNDPYAGYCRSLSCR